MSVAANHSLSVSEINSLVEAGEPFGFGLLPGDNTPCGELEVGRWLAPYADRVIPRLTTGCCGTEESHGESSDCGQSLPSTDENAYLDAVSKVIESCAARDGKTVFSREITGRIGDNVTPGSVFSGLCAEFPDTFRYIFNLPGEGVWIGATPEILLNVDLKNGSFSTMALAGTRRRSNPDEAWDEKNIIEHRIVADYIAARLNETGVSFLKGPTYSHPYGSIEHLCCRFSGRLRDAPYSIVLDALNPTPALCGTPKQAAIDDISRYESHERSFYGGFIAIKSDDRFDAYANLRCLRMRGNRYSVYAGGGITKLSDPRTEYLETEAKAAPRIALLR